MLMVTPSVRTFILQACMLALICASAQLTPHMIWTMYVPYASCMLTWFVTSVHIIMPKLQAANQQLSEQYLKWLSGPHRTNSSVMRADQLCCTCCWGPDERHFMRK
jgi:hypothetical protein